MSTNNETPANFTCGSVKDFLVIVAMDSQGNSSYHEVAARSRTLFDGLLRSMLLRGQLAEKAVFPPSATPQSI